MLFLCSRHWESFSTSIFSCLSWLLGVPYFRKLRVPWKVGRPIGRFIEPVWLTKLPFLCRYNLAYIVKKNYWSYPDKNCCTTQVQVKKKTKVLKSKVDKNRYFSDGVLSAEGIVSRILFLFSGISLYCNKAWLGPMGSITVITWFTRT